MERVDAVIHEIERFYRALTGRELPPPPPEESAAIPPDRDPVHHVEEQLDRLLRSLPGLPPRPASLTPAVSIVEADDGFVVSLDVPGIERERMEVTAAGNLLDVKGRREVAVEGRPLLNERRTGDFRRTLSLPAILDPERLQAELRNGVLEVRVFRALTAGRRVVPIQ